MIFLVESNDVIPFCPCCEGMLSYRDSRLRVLKKEGGEKRYLLIRRFRCEQCHHYHTELPDCLTPYKHYETEVISGVIDGIVTANDADSENYPSAMTMIRWLKWFYRNMTNIEGYLQKVSCQILEYIDEILMVKTSLLCFVRTSTGKWLETILCIIYNGGGFLASLRE